MVRVPFFVCLTLRLGAFAALRSILAFSNQSALLQNASARELHCVLGKEKAQDSNAQTQRCKGRIESPPLRVFHSHYRDFASLSSIVLRSGRHK